ncbi:PASTA domain containing protein [Actinobacteria bacterium OK074]|nr:PASTA domain containing protein [Actinobacteria bacterium OK074]
MNFHVCTRRAEITVFRSAFRRIVFLLTVVLVLSGCDGARELTTVRAVAAGVPSLAPFFDEKSGLGHDARHLPQEPHGGLQAGNTPGLYGGSRQPTICDVDRLRKFLTDPANARKARAWAKVLHISTADIPHYIDRLTPVLLRHDTLVQNHDYKNGSAVPYNSLLQAGIAILVDQQGMPAAKCSCGNPLRPFKGDSSRISVKFENGNNKWPDYRPASVVTVKPAPRKVPRLVLVDIDDPARGIDRPVGTTGAEDSAFDTRERHPVPELTGTGYATAAQRLADLGLAATYTGQGAPPDDAAVTGSDPGPGTELEFGQYVTLSVDRSTTGGTTSDGGGAGNGTGGATGPGTADTGTAGGTSPGTPSTGTTDTSGTSASGTPSAPSSSSSSSSSDTSSGTSSAPPSSGTSAPGGGGSGSPSGSSPDGGSTTGGSTTGGTDPTTADPDPTTAKPDPTTAEPTTAKPTTADPTTAEPEPTSADPEPSTAPASATSSVPEG